MGLIKKFFLFIGVLFIGLIAALFITIGYTSDCPVDSAAASGDNSMRAIQYHCYGGPEVLRYTRVPKPEMGAEDILVNVKAAGVNPYDWHFMRGSPYVMRLMAGIGAPTDTGFGSDYAGVVTAIGDEVTKYAVGDRIFGGSSGALAEYVVLNQSRSIGRIPDNVSFEQAGAAPMAGITALQALRDSGELKAGQSVLINGASGGVGTFAVQIAKAMGAEVTGVCSTRNVDMVMSLGADYVVNYKTDDFVEADKKYDLIIDNVGNRSISELRSVLKPQGILVMVGGPSGDWLGPFKNNVMAMLTEPFVDQQLKGFLAVYSSEDFAALAELMQQGKVKSVIDVRHPLSDTAEAIRYSESGRARGKILITPI
ncbi:MAG: NAD(P)-dependent alcohol dehydrogenase [Gammaproteobacteria bacterium]|nr:NAD(P)-dependent alcohol dehydrogenase [Gammaproteobacteria bacterium]